MQFTDLAIEADNERLLFGNGGLALESRVVERTEHPNAVIYGLRLCLTHRRFFPLGIGSTDAKAAEAGARNYVGSVFSVVIEALVGGYEPSLNLKLEDGTLWDTMLGPLHVQGA